MAEEQNIGEAAATEATDATDAADQKSSQAQEEATKTYTQEEVDNMMARMKGSMEKKLLKPYEGLGDPEELRDLKTKAEQQREEQQLKRGEFEKTLQEKMSVKDSEIQKRDAIIKEYKVNTPLLDAAARYKSVNPEQVKSLLASNVQLGDDGEVVVTDGKGGVRYNDSGNPVGVDDLVREFLDSNPHFVQPTASTTHTKSNYYAPGGKLDISKLDMKNPADRQKYAEAKKAGNI
jgi:hypothetical protein